jgi:hypothetical protein
LDDRSLSAGKWTYKQQLVEGYDLQRLLGVYFIELFIFSKME